MAVGEEPDPSILPEGAGIEVSGWAGIVADPHTLATGRAGIFAGGDVVSGPKTIIDAVASGRRAAASIHEYLSGATDGEGEILATVRYVTAPERALTLDLATRPRAHAPLPMVQPGSFAATQVGFDEATARSEADRCFRCDAIYAGPVVDVRAGRGPDVVGDADRNPTRSSRHRWRHAMTPDQVSGLFDAGEAFVEGTIAAALVVLWLLALALHLGRGYMVRTTGKFTLRLGADLWWIIYVGLRDLVLVQVFIGSFIFFYPDVVAGQQLPITGGLAAVCAFAVLLIKLVRHGDETRAFRWEVLLLGLGATLYIVPYLLGVQMTELHGQRVEKLVPVLVTSLNPDLALPLCYLSGALIGVMGLFAVYYNLRSTGQRPAATTVEATR